MAVIAKYDLMKNPLIFAGFCIFRQSAFKKLFMKSVSICLISSLTLSQIGYATDVRQMLLDAKASFEEEELSVGLSPAQLSSAERLQQAAVDQQNALQDIQDMNFSLSTQNGDILRYVGNRLTQVERPDGTLLRNIQLGAAGLILSADLRLSDGSIQLYQDGQVIAYGMPDGRQVFYENGQIQKVISKSGVETLYSYLGDLSGAVTETTLTSASHVAKYDQNSKLKEVLRLSDGERTYFLNGMIQRVLKADNSELLFNRSTLPNGDTVVTPQAQIGNIYIDAAGNKFIFDAGNIIKIELPDGAYLENIGWNADNSLKDATLREISGARYIFRDQKLTQSYDALNVVANYTYTTERIVVSSQGVTWECLLDKTPVKVTNLDGSSSLFYASGAYKGLKEKDLSSLGVTTSIYEYQTVGGTVTVQKRDAQNSVYSINSWDSQSNLSQASNPVLKYSVLFPTDNLIDPQVVLTATGSLKTLKLNLLPGANSTYTFAGVTRALGITLNKNVSYKVEVRWETGRVAIYVYDAILPKPVNPTAIVLDRAWGPRFKVDATNAQVQHDAAGSTGTYQRTSTVREKNNTNLPGSPVFKTNFRLFSGSYKDVNIKAYQVTSGTTRRTLSFYYINGRWSVGTSDFNTTTSVTTTTTLAVLQALADGRDYTAELRLEGGRLNFYVYEKNASRPAVATASVAAFNVATRFDAFLINGTAEGFAYKNLSAPTLSSVQGKAISSRLDTIKNLALTKPSQTQNTSDFTSITYDLNLKVKEIVQTDGKRFTFENGLLKEAFDQQGQLASFSFTESTLSNLVGSEIVQNGLSSSYDAEGRLSAVTLNGMTIHYQKASDAIDYIEKPDGTEPYGISFGVDSQIQNATITLPDGEVRVYENSNLKALKNPDQTEILYDNQRPIVLITPEKLKYNFTYSASGIVAELDASSMTVPDTSAVTQMHYDLNYVLKKVVRKNNEIISYLADSRIEKIESGSETAKVFQYNSDGSYSVIQGAVQTFYTANQQPERAVISATASNPNALDIRYQYGKIREIYKNGQATATFKYTYEFEDGEEITVIDDLEEMTVKKYKAGDMISSLNKDTSVLSSYTYKDSKVEKVIVSRFGRQLHVYSYGYEGGLTQVSDEEGIVRSYDANQKLLFLEKDGSKFAYNYTRADIQIPSTTESQTVLPIGLYDTSALSVRPWDGGQAWYSWERQWGKDYLVTYWAGQWVEYRPSLSQAGDLRINFEATNDGVLPQGYTDFDIEVFVDGVSRGVFKTPASASQWNATSVLLRNLSQGQHTVRLKWLNDVQDATGNTNFKFRTLSMTQISRTTTYTTQQGEEIVEEKLIERRLADGSVAHYEGGKVSRITRPDGSVISDIVLNQDRSLQKATLTLVSGTKKVFDQNSVLEELLPDGTHFYFDNNQLVKVISAEGRETLYSYDRNGQGQIQAINVKVGDANLRYSVAGDLLGLTLTGVMTPQEVGALTQHVYQGGSGPNSVDGDFNTAQSGGFGGGAGSGGAGLFSEHVLPTASVVLGLRYRLAASASSSGRTDNGSTAYSYIETKDATTGVWTTVPGTYLYQNYNSGGGGGSTSSNVTSTNPAVLNVNLNNVIAIRARAGANAYANESGSNSGSAQIYEIQFSLADQSNLDFSVQRNAQGQVSGYSFSGYPGSISYDALGHLITSNPATVLGAPARSLDGVLASFVSLPHLAKLNVSALNAETATVLDSTLSADTLTSQEYSSSGVLETQSKADGTVTLFNAAGKPTEVLDATGNLLIEYSYDTDGHPSKVYLANARKVLPDEVAKAKTKIEEERQAQLLQLAEARNLAITQIKTQSEQNRQTIQSQINELTNQLNSLEGQSARGRSAKKAKSQALDQIRSYISQGWGNYNTVNQQESDAYAGLDTQIKTVSDKIASDSQAAFNALATQESNLKNEILRQETSPIVYDNYRRILGRDPSSQEYDFWIAKIDYTSAVGGVTKTRDGLAFGQALNAHLNSLAELGERRTYVQNIKASVASAVNGYVAMSSAEKQAFAQSLGMSSAEAIALSASDAQKILAWLNSRNLHFGQSAFLSLEALLDQKGIVYNREELARKAILVDILAGVISPLDDGDLVISIYSLNKVAGLYGLSLSGAKLSWEDLQGIMAVPVALSPLQSPDPSTSPAPVASGAPMAQTMSEPGRIIAHINGNHYVVITGITQDSITYIDPGIGKDKQNESITVTKAGFLKAWQGNVTLNQADFNSIKTIRGASTQAKALSAMEAKNIRGAFWGSLLGLIGSILTWIPGLNGIGLILTGISAAVSAIEGDWISAISSLVTLGLGGFGDALKGAFNSVVKAMGPIGQIFQAAGSIIGGVYNAVTGLVGNLSNALGGFLKGFGVGSHLATKVAQFAVSQGLIIATTKGFEIIGINPQIAGFLGSMASGAIMGGIAPETQNQSGQLLSRADMIRTSVQQAVTIGQFGNFGTQMGLDPIFSRILGNSLAVIQGIAIQNPTTTLDQAFSLVKKELTTSLTQYSLEKLGNSLGLNPMISSAIAAPIASNLASSLSTTKWVGQVATSANDGISVNTTQYRSELLGKNIAIAGPGTVERAWWDSVFGFLKNNVYMMAASAASAYYLTRPNVIGSGQTPPPATTTEMPLPTGAVAVTYQDYFTGQSKAGYQINSRLTNYIVYDKATGNPVKRVSNGVVEEGVFEGIVVLKADGSISLDYKVNPDYVSKGQIKYTTDTGGQARFKVLDGKVQEIYIDATSPDVVLNPGTTKDATNKVLNGIVKMLTLGLELSVTNGTVSKSTGGQQGS